MYKSKQRICSGKMWDLIYRTEQSDRDKELRCIVFNFSKINAKNQQVHKQLK